MNGPPNGAVGVRVAMVSFGAAALGVLAVSLLVGTPLRRALVLAAVVGVLFAAGNLVADRYRTRDGDR